MKRKNMVSLFAYLIIMTSCGGNDTPSDPDGRGIIPNKGVIELKDNQRGLSNPGMGWNQMFYTFDDVPVLTGNDKSDNLNWIPCDILSFRVSWAKMEPKEGQYNWKVIDNAANYWLSEGKRLAFKFYTNFLWDNPDRQATPLWLKDAGAKGHYLDGNNDPSDDSWMADYGDPILLEKLEKFYKAVAAHYSTDKIEFIELGSIGRVGEGNSYQIGVEPTETELKVHINLLRKCFPKTQLFINDDHGNAACLSAKTLGYGVDDHSIGVDASVNPPGRAYNKSVIDKFHDGKSIIGLEDDTWLLPDDWYLKQMTEAHANYCRIHTSPSNLRKADVRKIVNQMNLKMGYRIQFPRISVPTFIQRGQSLKISYSVRNAGVGYCQVTCYPHFLLKDFNGKEVSSVTDVGFDHQDLMSGSDNATLNRNVSLTIPANTAAGNYTLFISMVDETGKPLIKLPYDGDDGNKQYKLTQISIK